MPLDSVTIDGTTHTSGTPNTRDYAATSNALDRVITWGSSENQYKRGFAYC
jgi:hypothetical protein